MKDQPPKRSAEELVKMVIFDKQLQEQLKTDPVPTLTSLAQKAVANLPLHPPLEWDVWIYRMVVGSLAVVVLSVVAGAIALTAYRLGPIPDMLTAIGSAALGAIAGLLAPSPTAKK